MRTFLQLSRQSRGVHRAVPGPAQRPPLAAALHLSLCGAAQGRTGGRHSSRCGEAACHVPAAPGEDPQQHQEPGPAPHRQTRGGLYVPWFPWAPPAIAPIAGSLIERGCHPTSFQEDLKSSHFLFFLPISIAYIPGTWAGWHPSQSTNRYLLSIIICPALCQVLGVGGGGLLKEHVAGSLPSTSVHASGEQD